MISRRGLLRALLGGAAALAVAPLAKAAEKIEYTFPNRPVVPRFRVPDLRGRHEWMIHETGILSCNHSPASTRGWMPCDGRALDASEHAALFSVLGHTYGRV